MPILSHSELEEKASYIDELKEALVARETVIEQLRARLRAAEVIVMACGCIQRCKTCGARILWVAMAPDKKTSPIDANPHPEGNIRLSDKLARVMSKEEADAFQGPKYRSHFATCPQADQHRRRP